MELSIETPDAFPTFRRQKVDTFRPSSASCQITEENDVIDTSKLNFGDDELWLSESPRKCHVNLHTFLYDSDNSSLADVVKLSPKNIDTRTFTRPKKRFTRPSIEKYNEELYGTDITEQLIDSGIQLNGGSQDDSLTKPLHFDLGQTTTSVYFENILANAPMVDSFQNMSPPSLVNSMCSSTFANLMESSCIKNDPELREIRDTDYTVSILQQDSEPMFQSITESFSSLNSDAPENFLKKVSFIGKDESEAETTIVVNATFAKEASPPCNQTIVVVDDHEDFQDAKATSYQNLNSTYQRKPASTKQKEPFLNSTFQRRKSNRYNTVTINSQDLREDLNSTVIIESEKTPPRDDRTFENVKRLLDRRPSPSLDLNRLSYLVDKNDQINATFTHESAKRNSFGSTDSGENLDYMSLSSGSSKSSKLQSTDGINMIVDMPESPKILAGTFRKSPGLQMSTPKPRNRPSIWANHEISPIRDRNSDPEMSSSEQPPTVIQNSIRKQKSVGNIHQKIPNFRSIPIQSERNTIRGSHPNLKMSGLQKPTNLHSMGHTLKGSYTSLKPTNTNLPVAPPPLDTTVTVKVPAVAQVFPVPREVVPKSQDAQFVKPQPPRSGLPRPVTGIPRPVSRIPGPRNITNIRPVSKSAGQQGRY